MGNDIRDSTDTNEEHSSLKLSVYSTCISKLDKTTIRLLQISQITLRPLHIPRYSDYFKTTPYSYGLIAFSN